jgi:hypothetical protein
MNEGILPLMPKPDDDGTRMVLPVQAAATTKGNERTGA